MRIATANLDFATGAPKDRDHLAHLCKSADILLVQEAKNIHLAKLLPTGWCTTQVTTDPAHMGTAICYRTALVELGTHGLTLGARPFLPTGRRVKMLTRFAAHAEVTNKNTGRGGLVISNHWPPGRFSLIQPADTKSVKKLIGNRRDVIVGCDANAPIAKPAKALGLKARGSGIVGLLIGRGLHLVPGGKVTVDHYGLNHKETDHVTVGGNVAFPLRKKAV